MKEPIRVLQVFHGMDCGGAENMIMNLYRNIDRSKVQFDFLVHTRKKCFFDDEIKSLGGRIFHVPYYKVVNHFTYKKLLEIFFKKHPEIKIAHGHLGSCAHVYLSVAKKFGRFAIAHSHATQATDISIKNCLYRIFNMYTRRIADYYFACSKNAGIDRFGEKVVFSNRFSVLNNSIDTQKYVFSIKKRDTIRKLLGISDDCFVVGHIGRFNYPKNHSFLIDIFNEIINKEPKARLLLVGDGDLRPEIENKISHLGIKDNVIMTGVRSDVPDLLQAMDCFVFPSHYEGLGIVAVEAQAAGLHTICSDVVPNEVKLTDLVDYVSLKCSSMEWADTILKYNNGYAREDTSDIIRKKGYDIHTTANKLQRFYLKIHERSK